jgi:hypothetical protein
MLSHCGGTLTRNHSRASWIRRQGIAGRSDSLDDEAMLDRRADLLDLRPGKTLSARTGSKLLPEPLAAQLAIEGAGAAFVEAAIERQGEVGEGRAGDVGEVEV